MIKNKLSKSLLSELKNFEVQAKLNLKYQKTNDRKIFHSSTKVIASESDFDEEFKSMHQSIMTKITNYANYAIITNYYKLLHLRCHYKAQY